MSPVSVLDAAGALFVVHEEGYAGHPYWPGGASGVTLDYGYDLGQVSPLQFRGDWESTLALPAIMTLVPCVGMKGEAGRLALTSEVAAIRISRAAATAIFHLRTLPRYCRIAADVYPGLLEMPQPVRTAVVSLCVNRGGVPLLAKSGESRDGESTDGDRYDNERFIRQVIQEQRDPMQIAQALRQMGSDGPDALWPGPTAPNPGLRARRLREAALIEAAYPAAA